MLEVIKAGPQTTVQDLGRFGARHLGVCRAGAMDGLALGIANRLVGNPADAAALEITLPPACFRFLRAGQLALAGADCQALLDGEPVWPGWRVAFRAGQMLQLQAPRFGMRAYLALDGGIQAPAVMGSASTDLLAGFGGLDGRALRDGDRLALGPARPPAPRLGVWLPRPGSQIRVCPGPELKRLSKQAQERFWREPWQLTPNSNRMGYRLAGPALTAGETVDMLSHGVLPGLIQLPPDGQPIVLMADAQATGGYPRLGMVIEADLWQLGQARLGSQLHFIPTDPDGARQALRLQQRYQHRIERLLNAN
ncbi:biotin-dependent carboxyltransferase family protein [Chromobacterium subtsugae]|uniref:Biotin-dependent carboxyltransferase family protein n=2 Tax=Chromobacterium subtsugae TaxID=251747 RepID=A0ABS7FH68_9NEIS|nr:MULTISPECIES: biotin-dependent carboxyltransferase family protein [Chromobacterium]KZE87282.1 allophanate hydrolase [Chromobacterium sp. F49]MBW7568327.1 biotin-dependent carboxyltransferase family protein [Chromobacterium subtsugae]MBW8289409.1 biotin-dependent carboxyltransferase family protein [Chromobacterium subtsugae]WSE93277.1 biotin-dependent carboxyltransferase family protein [Chromobacterium subtsugae]WVH61655.1 biotin-dependent carboxyltransferase family protein [Chromobacterium 